MNQIEKEIIDEASKLTDSLIEFFDHHNTDELPAAICCVFAAVDLYRSIGWTNDDIKGSICEYVDRYDYLSKKIVDMKEALDTL
jgi:hypothetical protein